MIHRHIAMGGIVVLLATSPAQIAAAPLLDFGSPRFYWFLGETVLMAPGHEAMLALPDRDFTADVSVSIDFYFTNDDGSQGEFIGSTVEGSGISTVPYGQTESQASDLANRVGQGAAVLAGQEVGYQLSQAAANAARSAAANANPLNPAHQWGTWGSSLMSGGRNFLGRMVGGIGGLI